MPKQATALHVVEKGIHTQNFRPVPGSSGEWLSGNWWVSDETARSLVGRRLYLHPGQLEPSHSGGEILSFERSSADPKRKIFRFPGSAKCVGVLTPKSVPKAAARPLRRRSCRTLGSAGRRSCFRRLSYIQ